MKRLVITIDGPAGAGKTTTARGVARELSYRYLDTGALYRALALAVLRANESDPRSPGAVAAVRRSVVEPFWRGDRMHVRLDGEDVTGLIRTPEITDMVSPLSAVAEVRDLLLPVQRAEGREGGLVVDGRDTGSVVFPDADLKLYLVADARERAARRRRELAAAGVERDLDEVLREIEARDKRDSSRPLAPLVFPEGGVEVDTTGLTVEEQVGKIVALARERGA
jgi:cytidylate kinase